MTDPKFNDAMRKVERAMDKYQKALKVAEDEFIRRYGNHPSDIDCDSWIDTYHVAGGFWSAEDIEKEMRYKDGTLKHPLSG